MEFFHSTPRACGDHTQAFSRLSAWEKLGTQGHLYLQLTNIPDNTAEPSNGASNIDAQFRKTSSTASTSAAKNVLAVCPVWHGPASVRLKLGPRLMTHMSHKHGGMLSRRKALLSCDSWIEEHVWYAVPSDSADEIGAITAEQTPRRENWETGNFFHDRRQLLGGQVNHRPPERSPRPAPPRALWMTAQLLATRFETLY